MAGVPRVSIPAPLLARFRSVPSMAAGFIAAHAFNIASFFVIAWMGREAEIIGLRIVGEFLAGCFLFLLWRQTRDNAAPWRVLTPALAVASVAATVAINEISTAAPVLAAPLYCGLVYGLALGRDTLSRWLALRWFVYAGEASYALYMTHA